MLSSNWPPAGAGGAENYAVRLGEELRRRGIEVGAITLGVPGEHIVRTLPPRPHPLWEHRSASPVHRARFHAIDLWRPDAVRAITDAIVDFQPDVVHSHVVAGMSVRALTAPSRSGVRHIHTLHDHWLRCWRSTGTSRTMGTCGLACTALERFRSAALAKDGPDRYIAISEAIARSHRHLPPERVAVVLHPADVAPRERTRPVGDPPVIGFIGQLNPNKGVTTLLEAADRLASDARFAIAGTGRLADVVQERVSPSVTAWGWVDGDRREAFFDHLDCLVVPSVWPEPAGLVVREAAARGIPVIASRAGGLPEYVPASCSDLLFEPGDVDGLTASIRRFLTDPGRHRVDPAAIPVWDEHVETMLAHYADTGNRATMPE